MRLTVLVFTVCLAASVAHAAEFREARLDDGGRKLTITQSDGQTFAAPMLDDQDSFDKPAVSRNRRYVGWLALFPNMGASYSQPLRLSVLDSSKRTMDFVGDFAMIYGWCFTNDSQAVVYKYQLPHGITSIAFQMRRLRDGKILRSFRLEPIKPDADEAKVIRANTPAWASCTRDRMDVNQR